MPVVYLIGSLRNPHIGQIGNEIRDAGFEVFDDWFAASPTADDAWQEYEKHKGTSYKDALKGYAAKHVFAFDLHHLNRADIVVLTLPAGKSGHLELGYSIGRGKPGYVLFDAEPDRWDVMYQFAKDVFFDTESMIKTLKENHLT